MKKNSEKERENMFEKLQGQKRLLLEIELKPAQGERFQPTGFPDLGAATYQIADGRRKLLVESAQSVANRLESTILGPDNELIPELAGLSYIQVKLTGASSTATNSLIEAHRINSPFIISNDVFKKGFLKDSQYEAKKPINWQKIASALFKYDVNSLLHGVFLANLEDGRAKVARSVSGFIEASDVQEVVSGGVKNNPIDPTGTLRAKNYDKDVYGNVPYQRVEYTAGDIRAFFNLDLGLLRSYALGDDAFELLVALALFKIRAFLEGGTRLRTACDLMPAGELSAKDSQGFVIPSKEELLQHLKRKIQSCKNMFPEKPITSITTETVVKAKGKPDDSE
jgi:CRISPR-associated protein Csb1